MSIFSHFNDDEDYEKYLNSDGNMFAKKDRSEWQSIRNQARDIASGLVLGTFQRDEEVWAEVKKLERE